MVKKKKLQAAKKAAKETSKKKGVAKKGTTRSLSSREYEKLWKTNRNAGNDFEDANVEPGIYSATLSTVKKGLSRKGDHFIAFNYIITEGEHSGGRLSNYCSLHTEFGSRIAGQTLSKLDYNMDEIEFSDLEEIAETLTEEKYSVEVEVKARKDGNGVNTYLRGIVE